MSQKQQTMLWQLSAQLGKEFNGTFNSAKKVLSETQKQIKALNTQQGDISAYKRQEDSVRKAGEKLELYKKQLSNVQKEMQESGSYSSALANKEAALEQKIKDASEALAQKKEKLEGMGRALEDAGVNTADLNGEYKKLKAEIEELSKAEEKAGEEAEEMGENATDAFECMSSALAAIGLTKALKEIYNDFKQCVDMASTFHATMSTVEALSGASKADMSELSSLAKELGAATKFTATEAAEAMTYMGMAGWSAQQMLSGMDGVLQLAAASGEQLGLVSDIVTDNLTAFGLKASDTAHFSDVLAAAATNSNTSVSIMGETFKQSASVAGALGYSVEDVATAVGLMANAGVKGSIAGTALKNTFNGLLEGATLSAAAIGEVDITALKADGTMKSFGETIDELRGLFGKMSEAEKVSNAIALSGKRGYNGLLAIVNATNEDFEKLVGSVNECTGAARKMADVRLDNLAGQMTLLESATDAVKTTIGEAYSKEFKSLAKAATEAASKINEFMTEHPVLLRSILAVSAGLGTAVAALSAYVTIKKLSNNESIKSIAMLAKEGTQRLFHIGVKKAETAATAGATAAQEGLNASMAANPIGLVVVGLAALTVGLAAYTKRLKEAAESQTYITDDALRHREELKRLTDEYERAKKEYGENSKNAEELREQLDAVNDAYSVGKQNVFEYIEAIRARREEVERLTQANEDNSYKLDTQELVTTRLISRLKELAEQNGDTTKTNYEALSIIEMLNEAVPGLNLSYAGVMDSAQGFEEYAKQVAKAYYEIEKAKQQYARLGEVQAAKIEMQKTVEENKAAVDTLKKSTGELESDFDKKTGKLTWVRLFGAFSKDGAEVRAAKKGLKELEGEYDANAEALKKLEEEEKKLIGELEGVGEVTENVSGNNVTRANELITSMRELQTEYVKTYSAAQESLSQQYSLWDTAEKVSAKSVSGMVKALGTQQTYWKNYADNMEKLKGKTDEVEGLSELLTQLSDGSKDSVAAIAGMANASTAELKKLVEANKATETERNRAAKGQADMKLEYDKKIAELEAELNKLPDLMHLETESKTAAQQTINAYIDALKQAGDGAVLEASLIGQRVAEALANGKYNTVNPYKEEGYASGTVSASPGVRLVGEAGPELIDFRGGERVYTAEDTRKILSGGGVSVTVSPVISFSGGMGENAQPQIDELAEKIKDMVLDGLEEAGIDRARMRLY